MRPIEPRGVSEGTGVAVLVVLTVVATASVGMTATLIDDDSNEFGAEFTFDYSGDLKVVLIFYDEGDSLRAGDIVIEGPENQVTWAEVSDVEANATVEPSNIPVRLSQQNAYGAEVAEEDFVEIRYVPDGESSDDEESESALDDSEGTVLATWNEPDEEDGGDNPIGTPES